MVCLVTGATGFVGRTLCKELTLGGVEVRRALRGPVDPSAKTDFQVGDLGVKADWRAALNGCEAVVHLAGHAHQKSAGDQQAEVFERVNLRSSAQLAREALAAGVRRFVFVSSVKVHGEVSEPGKAFTEMDAPRPIGPYARSKYEAEQALEMILGGTSTELVIVRSPFIYGPNGKANLATLIKAVERGWPLPLASLDNQRSMVALQNLCDFLRVCVHDPRAAGQTFLVSDGHDVATPEFIRELARARGLPARLFPVSPALLAMGFRVLGRRHTWEKIAGDLRVDIGKARRLLGWAPPLTMREALMFIFPDAPHE